MALAVTFFSRVRDTTSEVFGPFEYVEMEEQALWSPDRGALIAEQVQGCWWTSDGRSWDAVTITPKAA